MALISRFGASAGLAAALSMTATPAFAAELPQGLIAHAGDGSAIYSAFDASTYDSDTDIAEWRRGWRRGWRRHRRVDAGDVIAGVLILGGIAAVANAANNNRRRNRDVVIVERDRTRDYDRRDDRRDNRNVRRNDGTRGLEGAVDQCVAEIQRDVRVDSVDSADRTERGWIVTGSLFNGSGFTCAVASNGRIDAIEYSDFRSSSLETRSEFDRRQARADGQWDDDTYVAAREAREGPQGYDRDGYESRSYRSSERSAEPLVPLSSDRLPAYPGGPVPGESYPE